MKLLILLSISLGVCAISCPPGYTDEGDGSCYMWQGRWGTTQRNVAYQQCAEDNAYVPDIPNAFQNTKYARQASYTMMWLGLTCVKNSSDSCVWDNGKPMTSSSYHNFDIGNPNIQNGPCVYMDVNSGKWRSADCSNVANGYGCKYTPDIDVPYCYFGNDAPTSGVFRGKCYRITDAHTIGEAASACSAYHYTQTSIHSDGENAFISGMVIHYSGYSSSLFLGLQSNGTWVDKTMIDYMNYDYEKPMDKCVSMVNGERNVPSGKWISTPCSNNYGVTVCKHDSTEVIPITAGTTGSTSVATTTYSTSTFTTLAAETTPTPISLNCVFVIDWFYLGSSTNASVNASYLTQRAFVNTVASQLYATPGLVFGADVAPYGDSNAGMSDMVIYDSYIRDENSFQGSLSTVLPIPQQYPFDVCSAQDALNPGSSPNLDKIGRDCLVFFSGGSDTDFANCASNPFIDPLDTSLYKFIVGASLNEETGVQSIANTTVPISNNFDGNDASSLVAAILDLSRDSIPVVPVTQKVATTTPTPIILNCVFVLDWYYLGSSTNITAYANYPKQRDFVSSVASVLYTTPGLLFGADIAPYGDRDAGMSDFVLYDNYIEDKNIFQFNITMVRPIPQQYPFDVCSAQDALNPGVSPNLDKIGRDCLVFFSGESDTDFANCASNLFVDPLDTSLYKFIVGASLTGQTGVQSISNTTVPISSQFSQEDATSLVAAILDLARATRN